MRQFIAEDNLDDKGCLVVIGKKFRYLFNVLRVKVGDMVYVRLPSGLLQNMTVARIEEDKKRIILQVAGDKQAEDNHAMPVSQVNGPEIILFMFIAKPQKMELVIRQAVECGVSRIVPVIGAFCQSGPVEACKKKAGFGNQIADKDDRYSRIITEAREQSGSPVGTVVNSCVTVEQAAALWTEISKGFSSRALVLYEQSEDTTSMHQALYSETNIEKACLAVGAEGGISPEEIALLKNQGFIPVHFSTNILRCETAALYGIAGMQIALTENNLWQCKE